ncbi:pseudouridine synthase PUS4 KNAG_0K02320 [Huiozyma naganishii CBS 8797]|uniref:tRNA pseudouridine(55) synthase n=1 Tax=Huiozyma naganishii (strain ATCC MYA-139 / BCRC 22969 / CBS 8797 / KCTC 17520 / NBRC 10181 / NCYC 3082 / Yp74L-3) TaxID=1071383 RepID=J7RCK2_HUIN7|nr:hypothetical protein KNAG_0K02320 [Kazachstania naganishii CBS 8797]CCK72595.1 hypothetical protein KNAG_0K02320 [Kazachstania naganishii CBS 8797]
MNGIFAIEKPSGITSNHFMLKVQHLFNGSSVFSKEIARLTAERMQQYREQTGKTPSKRKLRKVSKVKMGHGGTLDPLASGVLIIGVGSGTKQLANYLSGTVKVYECEALFGVSTTSGDVEGEILSETSTRHLKMEELQSLKEKFEGSLKQTPPIFAALKMNGKPLHEYAREGKPLPRAIEPREVTIYDLTIFENSLSKTHNYPLLRPTTYESKDTVKNLNANLLNDTLYFSKEYCEAHNLDTEVAQIEDPIPLTQEESDEIASMGDQYRSPLLHFKAKVSSGTYIRSLVSDVGKALRSSSYMVKLVRLQQQKWSLEKGNVFKLEDFTENHEDSWTKVLQEVFDRGSEVNISEEFVKAKQELKEVEPRVKATTTEVEEAVAEAPAIDTDSTQQESVEGNTGTKRKIDDV